MENRKRHVGQTCLEHETSRTTTFKDRPTSRTTPTSYAAGFVNFVHNDFRKYINGEEDTSQP